VTQVVGLATRFPIAANEQVLSTKVVSLDAGATGRSLSYVVPAGKRAISIHASAVQDAGGLLLPGDYVDIVVVYDVEFPAKAGDPASRQKVQSYLAQTVLQNVEILAVSQTIVDLVPEATPSPGGQRARNSEAKPQPD